MFTRGNLGHDPAEGLMPSIWEAMRFTRTLPSPSSTGPRFRAGGFDARIIAIAGIAVAQFRAVLPCNCETPHLVTAPYNPRSDGDQRRLGKRYEPKEIEQRSLRILGEG